MNLHEYIFQFLDTVVKTHIINKQLLTSRDIAKYLSKVIIYNYTELV